MAATLTLLYDQNTRRQDKRGDIIIATYTVTLSGNYPLAGELLNVSAQFLDAHDAWINTFIAQAGLQADLNYLPLLRRAAGTTQSFNLMFYGENDPSPPTFGTPSPFIELAAGAYPAEIATVWRMTVVGRPITDEG